MKRLFLRSLFAALVSASLVSHAMAQDNETALARVQRTKVLRVGAIAGAIPYFNKNIATGKWEGFGPDFAESLARSLGAKVEFVETTWGNAVLDLQSNKIDVMYGLAPTPAREKMVGFSNTLFQNTYTLVCRNGFPQKTWEQLDAPENKIVVDLGSSHDQLVSRVLPKASVTRLETSGAATLALQTGKADCQVLVVLLAKPLLAKRPDIGRMYIPAPAYSAPVSIGLRKETDPGLTNAVNAWLAKARSSGEVQRVILADMEKLAGVPASSFPPEVKF